MQRTLTALNGALALCALLFLTSCATNGPVPPSVVVKPEVVEVPVRQFVELDLALLEVAPLPPAPAPERSCPSSSNPNRRCYSNRQLDAMLTAALESRMALAEQVLAIARAVKQAKADQKDP